MVPLGLPQFWLPEFYASWFQCFILFTQGFFKCLCLISWPEFNYDITTLSHSNRARLYDFCNGIRSQFLDDQSPFFRILLSNRDSKNAIYGNTRFIYGLVTWRARAGLGTGLRFLFRITHCAIDDWVFTNFDNLSVTCFSMCVTLPYVLCPFQVHLIASEYHPTVWIQWHSLTLGLLKSYSVCLSIGASMSVVSQGPRRFDCSFDRKIARWKCIDQNGINRLRRAQWLDPNQTKIFNSFVRAKNVCAFAGRRAVPSGNVMRLKCASLPSEAFYDWRNAKMCSSFRLLLIDWFWLHRDNTHFATF